MVVQLLMDRLPNGLGGRAGTAAVGLGTQPRNAQGAEPNAHGAKTHTHPRARATGKLVDPATQTLQWNRKNGTPRMRQRCSKQIR